jgi:hypothetical protein
VDYLLQQAVANGQANIDDNFVTTAPRSDFGVRRIACAVP